MQVIFKKSTKLGGKSYTKSPKATEIPDHLAHNNAFRKMVVSGQVQLMPRDALARKVQMSKDQKALRAAQTARKTGKANQAAALASHAERKLQRSAQGTSGANPLPGGAGQVPASIPPAKPTQAAEPALASAPGSAASAKKGS